MDSREDIMQKILERNTASLSYGDASDGPSLKDSLAAVRNATQAAARIHQVFRVQSFQKRQLKEYGDDKFGMSDERALSLIVVKSNKPGQHDEHVHDAAIRIQNKFRGWKGRKEFLIIRQRIVKIQVHCDCCSSLSAFTILALYSVIPLPLYPTSIFLDKHNC